MKLSNDKINDIKLRIEELEKLGIPRDIIPTILLMEALVS